MASDFIDVNIAVHDGVDGQGGYALHSELIHDVLAMGDDRAEGNVQPVGNFFVDESLNDECHHLYFAVGENLLLQDLWHWGQVAAVAMCMLYQVQHLANELALGLVDAERVEFCKLRGVGQ